MGEHVINQDSSEELHYNNVFVKISMDEDMFPTVEVGTDRAQPVIIRHNGTDTVDTRPTGAALQQHREEVRQRQAEITVKDTLAAVVALQLKGNETPAEIVSIVLDQQDRLLEEATTNAPPIRPSSLLEPVRPDVPLPQVATPGMDNSKREEREQ